MTSTPVSGHDFVMAMGLIFLALIAIGFVIFLMGQMIELYDLVSNYRKAKDLETRLEEREVRIRELETALALANEGGPFRATQTPLVEPKEIT